MNTVLMAGILKPLVPPRVYVDMETESQQWTEGLNPCGHYYSGYTDDLQQMLTKHYSATVSTFGVCRSHTNHAAKDVDKENLDTESDSDTSQNSK